MKKFIITTLILSLLLSLILTGCASKAAATTTSTETTATVKTVVVAVASEEKPLSYTNENGKLVGYEVEALKAIDALIPEYEFDIQAIEADAQQIGLDAGKYALIAEGLYKTKERLEKYLLPEENVGASTIVIITRGNDNSIQTLDDLVGKVVAPVSPNGGIFNFLTAYNNTHDAKINITTQEGLSAADRYKDLVAGKYDAVVLPSLGFEEVKAKLGLDIKKSDPVKVNYTYFVLAKDQNDLNAKVNEALKSLKANGKLSELAIKYFGEDILSYKEG